MSPTATLPSQYSLLALETVDSTNEEAKRLAAAGAPDGTVIWSRVQTAGRGRRSRAWISEPGNLYFSLLLRPDYPVSAATQMGFIACNTVAEAVAAVVPRGTFVTCKWPNDVLIEGRKVSGILLESAARDAQNLDWLIVGIGVNIAHHPTDSEYPATDLSREGAEGLSVERLLESVCARYSANMVLWRNMGFAPIRRNWMRRAHGLGQPLTVRLETTSFDGVFEDLDEDGALMLRQEDGIRKVTAGDVFFPGLGTGDG